MSLSDYDREYIEDLICGDGDWFTAILLRLCAKADSTNLERIRKGFPDVVRAFEAWRRGPISQDGQKREARHDDTIKKEAQ